MSRWCQEAKALLTFVLLLLSTVMPQPMLADVLSADSVVPMMHAYVKRNNLSVGRFESDIYLRFQMQTIRKNMSIRLVPDMFKVEKGTHNYAGECHLRFNYLTPGITDYREIAFYSTHPRMREIRNRVFSDLNIFIYEPCLMKDRILSPLHVRNRSYYKYQVDSLVYVQDRPYYRISIRPKFYNTQLVKGHVYASALDGKVDRFTFHIAYDMVKTTIAGQMGVTGLESLLPTRVRMKTEFVFLKNKIVTDFNARIRYDVLEPFIVTNTFLWNKRDPDKYDLSYSNRLKLDTTKVTYGADYFKNHRPYPLQSRDSLLVTEKTPNDEPVDTISIESEKVGFISDSMEDALLSSHRIGLSTKGDLRIPPVLTPSMFQWSKRKGLSLQTKLRLTYETHKYHLLDATLRMGYNFKEKQFYWRFPVSYTFIPDYLGKIHFEMGNGNRTYSSLQADEVRRALSGISNYDSLMHVFNQYSFDYYRDFYTKFNFSIEPFNGVNVTAGIVYHCRTLVDWNKVAQEHGLIRSYRSLAPRLHLVWTPNSYYYKKGTRKIYQYSNWPKFSLDYERGVKWFGWRNEYERWEFDTQYTLPLYALRSLYFRFGTGLYTRQKSLYFLDYDNFSDNNLPLGWDDEISGQFHLLDARWYNESEYYVRLCSAYESPMLLLSRFKYLSHYIQKERLYCNMLAVHALLPYIEVGYGISTHVFDTALFLGGANGTGFSLGVKFAMKLFDEW